MELPYFYPDLLAKCLNLWDQLLNYPYFKQVGAMSTPPESAFRRRVWEMLARGQKLVAALQEQYQRVQLEVSRGTPFPLLTPESPRSSSPGAP